MTFPRHFAEEKFHHRRRMSGRTANFLQYGKEKIRYKGKEKEFISSLC